MIPFRSRPPLPALAIVALTGVTLGGITLGGVGVTASTARGEEIGQVLRIADRCEIYGPGFVDVGGGTCARMIVNGHGHVHVDAGMRPAEGGESWAAGGGTSNAAMRTDGLGMLPHAPDAQHLRIGGESYPR